MKRKWILGLILIICLSSCTLSKQTPTVSVDDVSHLDVDVLSLILENALEGYIVVVNGKTFDCEFLKSNPDLMECVGPAL